MKNKNEKSKVISTAQKTINENNCSSHLVGNNKVIVQIPKEEIEDGLASILTVGIMFALKQIGVKDLDITIKETKANFNIVVEK